MYSALLVIASRYLYWLLLVLSLIVLYRGHNLPGGGFIGGLIAASAVLVVALSAGWDDADRLLPIRPLNLIVLGLSTAIVSAFIGPLTGAGFMEGVWLPFFDMPLLGKVKLGTPLLFDVGVYLTVIGFSLKCAQALGMEEEA